ncbi:hypothetical protein Bca52824_073486 [Brassica carinata]|uniref:Uncharacterized protein n=1 Tax=Brassica carinata TaxID=52824 RepID=A0A8X7QAB2_BRACI|nr:hypothetical protein Bca52824_073486 [Brassica carinata]
MEKNICRRLGVPEAPINKSRKRKANEDNHGQSEFQFSGGKQTRSPIHMAKKTKPTASSPGGKKHSYALRSGDGNDASEVATKGDTPALFEREKCFENEYHNTRSPPFDENIADEGMRTPNAAEDCLQPENSGTAVTALTGYSNVLLVRPQSYVSPPKSTLTRRYRDEEHVPVAWEERNTNIYNSVGFLSLATGNHWRYLPCNYHIFRPPPSENKVSSPLREVAQGHRPPQQGK